MDAAMLRDIINRPETHKKILGDYHGAYTLGISRMPEDPRGPQFILRIQGESSEGFPTEIEVNNEKIEIEVNCNFISPRPLRALG